MAKQREKQEKGYGKHVLAGKIKEKFADSFAAPGENEPLVSTAMLLEGIHFSLVYFPLKHLGYKAVVSAIAGIYSAGTKPLSIAVNLALGSRHGVEDIEAIMEGVEFACRNYDLKITGINFDSSLTGLTIAVTATGASVKTETELGVSPSETDLVVVTGDLGAAFMGLQLLERERRVFEETGGAQPMLKGFEYVIGRQLKPEIPVHILDALEKAGIAISSQRIVSEGLASDLIGLARERGFGARLHYDKVPFSRETADAGREFNIEPLIAALSGGDDFEIMFTCPVSQFSRLSNIEGITVAGHLTPAGEGFTLALQDGSLAELKAQGWEESV